MEVRAACQAGANPRSSPVATVRTAANRARRAVPTELRERDREVSFRRGSGGTQSSAGNPAGGHGLQFVPAGKEQSGFSLSGSNAHANVSWMQIEVTENPISAADECR